MMTELPVNPSAAAAVLMDECENDVDRAKTLARQRLAQEAYEELRTQLWHAAIDQEIDQLWRSSRAIVKRETERSTTVFRARSSHTPPSPRVLAKGEVSTPNTDMMAAVNRSIGRWLAFAMPNGTKLEDWTKQDLRQHGRAVITNGRAAVKTGAFFLAVAEMLPKQESRVGDVLVEADLERLWRQQAQLPA